MWRKIAAGIDKVSVYSNYLAMLAILGMAFVQVYDVSTRGLRLGIIPGIYEVGAWLLCMCTFFCLSHSWQEGAHVKVTLVYDRFGRRTRKIIDVASRLLALIVFGVIGWQGLLQTMISMRMHERSFNLSFPIQLSWIRLLVPIGSFLFCLVLIKEILVLLSMKVGER